MRSIAVATLLAMAAETTAAGDLTFEVSIDAAGLVRKNSPVLLELRAGKEIPAETAAKLPERLAATLRGPVDGAGGPRDTEIPAQAAVERDDKGALRGVTVGWIEKSLEAAEKRRYRLTLAEAPGERAIESFRIVDGEGFRDLLRGETPVSRHMIALDLGHARREETYKPYLHISGFHGEGFITKGPGGKYTHHRGVFLGWNKTTAEGKTWDFWHCPNVHQRHSRFLADREALGPVFGRVASLTDWVAEPVGKSVGRDRREITAWWQPPGQLLVDLDVAVETLAGDMHLDGDPQHAGLQFRAAQEVAEREKETVYVLSEGAVQEKNDVVTHCAWAACLFKIQGKPYAVMHMSHPADSAGTVYSTRAYGRFGAFAPHDVKPDRPLRLRYRLLILDTDKHPDVSRGRFQRKYEDYARPMVASVAGTGGR